MSVRLSKTHVDKALKDVAAGARAYDLIDSQQPGLLLRVGPRGARWAFKAIRAKTTLRLTIGSPPEISLDEARTIAAAAQRGIVNRLWAPDDRFLEAELVKLGKVAPRPAPPPRDPAMIADWERHTEDLPYWTWEQARTEYLTEVKRTKRPDTHKDYSAKLHMKELAGLAGRKVRRITLEDLAKVVYEVHKSGRETQAFNLASALRPMWRWLWLAHVRSSAGFSVEDRIGADISKLQAPDKTPGLKPRANGKVPGKHVATPTELGTILAVARCGLLDPTVSLALELLVTTVQRRRPIADAQAADFVPWVEMPGWGVWSMGPRHRKTADKRDDQTRHVLPLPPSLWARLAPQVQRSQGAGTPFMFPQVRPWRLGEQADGHMSDSAINHRLLDLGLRASPHDVRRGFSTHGRRILGIARSDTKLIMDHAEGIPTDDVLEAHYTADDRLDLKQPVMARWVAWCDEQAAAAAAGLPPLDQLATEIATRRRIREKEGQAKTAAKRKAAEEKAAAEAAEEDKRILYAAVLAAA
ncbi:integrase [Methylorubrum populi]|uniref:integrase family protein n=1 Tax=Methylorubrum populi TaxID=223967 RepID=UPI00114E3AA7|nr:integrase family protein [Methylorubrum populi]QDI79002.1 integrase [Methylorubrum populi]